MIAGKTHIADQVCSGRCRLPLRLRRLVLVLACVCSPALARAEEPGSRFYEQEPYDIVILDDAPKTQIKALPLNLPDRKVPKNPPRSGKLRLRRLEDPDEEYDVSWQNIGEIKLFEQLILERAKKLVAEGKFNDAFDYYEHLRREYPKVEGLEEGIGDFLYEEAKDWQRKRNYENALVLLHTLYDRQQQRPGLEGAMAAATGKLLEKNVAAGDYATVRRLVRELRVRFPQGKNVAQFEEQMNQRAVKVVAEGREKLAAADPEQALALARRALAMWPKADGARELAEEAFTSFPHVVVGVTSPYSAKLTEPMTSWSARRTQRLTQRRLFEFIGYGADAGDYVCPFGRYENTDLGRGLTLQIAPNIPWLRGDMLSGYDVARRLLAMAQPSDPDFLPGWAEACKSIGVQGVDTVDIHFHVQQLLPMALLAVPLAEKGDAGGAVPTSIEPYLLKEAAAERTTFLAAPEYFARTPTQTQGIVERRFATRTDATEALRLGEITVVDRLAPWEIERLKGAPGVVIEAYSLATVHCLVPNLAHPVMRQRGFRRALLYAIDRRRILSEHILRRHSVAGCEVISGPFAKGSGLSDTAGYAYDDEIEPRAYEPRLAMTLSAVTLRDLVRGAGEGEKPTELPALTLAYPADEIARFACNAIQKNLELVGLKVTLREIPLGEPVLMGEDDHLLYTELAVAEPLVDARRLFGEQGLIGGASTYVSLVLRQIETATSWNEARQALEDLHRLAHEEVSVLPLWQISEYFAYHKSLSGITPRPATLYQNIEQWQAQVPLPAEDQ